MKVPAPRVPDHRIRVAAERRDRMRQRLFESAMAVVTQDGPAAATIDRVIAAAEVSRGTFYNYFESPEALFDALAVTLANEFIQQAELAVARLDDPAERVATGMRLVIDLALRNPNIAGFIVRLGWPATAQRPLVLDFVRRDLEAGMRRQVFLSMPMQLALDIVAMTVLGAINGLLAPRPPRALAAQAVASALRALGVRAREAERIVARELHPPALADGVVLLG